MSLFVLRGTNKGCSKKQKRKSRTKTLPCYAFASLFLVGGLEEEFIRVKIYDLCPCLPMISIVDNR